MTGHTQPSTTYLSEALGLEHAIVGFYDLPSIVGVDKLVEKRGCLFACFENWQRGERVHLSRARPGCPGSAHWLCGAPAMTEEAMLRLLVEAEGLKSTCDGMRQFLDRQAPYSMRGPHLVIGPLVAELHAFLRTVTIFCNPDQLSALTAALFYLTPADGSSRLVPSCGAGCLQIAGIFPNLAEEWAVISSTDIAMRVHLPANLLSLTVTRPLFERLCHLDGTSPLGKPFWRRLRSRRQDAPSLPFRHPVSRRGD